jgi:Asp-tRNA(Asn)/Glu-tRNA(Gln) amidotransferase A subunit family amidase
MDLSSPHTPLAGMSLAVKDLVAVAGRPVGAASSVRQDAPIALRDAPVVAALRNAGAIVIGTTSLHEFAFGTTGINDYLGTTPNPHDPTRVPGGSSSGSAVAVAEGSARIAIGTDTGGSVRIPASLCGVVGFKPAFGTYPIAGVFPLSPTLDHVGFLARSVGDIQIVHSHLAQPVSGKYQPTRVGLVRAELEKCDSIVRPRVEMVVQRLNDRGCTVVDVDEIWPSGEETFAASTAIMFSEAAAVHKRELQRDATRYGPDVRHRLLQGLAISAAEYITALQARQPLKTQVHAALTTVDCVIGPTVGLVAPKIDEGRDPALSGRLVAFTRLGNLVGIPALSQPIPGPGLPVGLQILANRNEQALKIAAFFEQMLAE